MKAPENPPVYEPLPFLRRMRLRALIWVFKSLIPLHLGWLSFRSKSLPANRKPTLVKRYANSPLPDREVRIFIPQTYKSGDKPLSLLIDIHGGGFCIGAPAVDDRDNLILCHEHGFCVVSIPYRLGPTHKWPTAPLDCAGMITAVLEDDSLPVDRSRVATMGYSAGGNLSITAVLALKPEVRAKIAGIAAYYPTVDQVPDFGLKKQRQTMAPNGKDMLHILGPAFNSGYIPPGTKKDEPLLSPIYAQRDQLPPKISILGCEYDILCVEASEMAEDLASQESGDKVPLLDGRTGWTKGGIRWELIKGTIHGFNQVPVSGAEAVLAKDRTLKMHAGVTDWLKKEVFV